MSIVKTEKLPFFKNITHIPTIKHLASSFGILRNFCPTSLRKMPKTGTGNGYSSVVCRGVYCVLAGEIRAKGASCWIFSDNFAFSLGPWLQKLGGHNFCGEYKPRAGEKTSCVGSTPPRLMSSRHQEPLSKNISKIVLILAVRI